MTDPPELIVRRNLWQLVAAYVPGALVSDRTAFESVPAIDSSIFVVASRVRDIELPGMIIRTRRGAGPQPEDHPLVGGLYLSSTARAFLDNLVVSRRRNGRVRRTLGIQQVERYLETLFRRGGVATLDRLREDARQIAPRIGRDCEFEAFDGLIDGLVGTVGRPRIRSYPHARPGGAAGEATRDSATRLFPKSP